MIFDDDTWVMQRHKSHYCFGWQHLAMSVTAQFIEICNVIIFEYHNSSLVC